MSVRIFLSTVTDEFRDYRDQLRRDLTRHNVEVKVQEDFKDSGTVPLDKLDLYIESCDAVVHLVGDMTGASAKPESTRSILAKHPDLPDRLPPLRQPLADGLAISYTQWEAWLALYHGKLLVIAQADDTAPRGPNYAPTDDSRAAQQEHLARLSAVERYPGEPFSGPDNLAKLILSGAIPDLLRSADTRRLKTRMAVLAVVALLVVVGGVGGYLAWDRHQRDIERATAEKRNEELAALARKAEARSEELLALTRKLVANSQTPPVPGREQAVGAAVASIATSAATGDTRLQDALDLLKAGNVEEAEKRLRTVADQAQTRIREESKQAAIAWRNLGAIAGLRDPKSAREAYTRAAMLDPEDADSLFRAAWFQVEAGDLAASERSYRQLLVLKQAEPDSQEAYWARLGLSDIELDRGRLGPALTGYRSAYAVADRLAKASPGNTGWQRNLSAASERIGNVLTAQGKLAEALRSYGDVLAIRERLAKADPEDTGWQLDLSVSYDAVGGVLSAQGNLVAALKSFRDAFAIRDRLAKADPGNTLWQRAVSVSYTMIGDVLADQGKLKEALQSFNDGLAIRDRLAKADPENAGLQSDLSVSHEKIGNVQLAQGDLEAALKSYREAYGLADRLAKADPRHARWQRSLSIAHEKIGDVQFEQSNLADALTSYRDAFVIRGHLAAGDPGNTLWQRDLSVAGIKIGDVLEYQDDLKEALKSFREAFAIRDRLAKADPGNTKWQHDLAVAHDRIGGVLLAQNDLEAALQSFRDGLAILERVVRVDSDNASSQRDLATFHAKLAATFRKSGDTAGALAALQQGRAIMLRMTSLSPDNASWKRDLAWFDGQIAELSR